jgi:hypothetical protein
MSMFSTSRLILDIVEEGLCDKLGTHLLPLVIGHDK